MPTMLEELNSAAVEAQAKALASYRELLGRADAPEPTDAAALADVLRTLELSQGDVAADLAALKEAARHQATIERLEAQGAGVRAELASLPTQASMKAEQAVIQEKRVRRSDLEDAGGRISGARANVEVELSRLRQRHQRLFPRNTDRLVEYWRDLLAGRG